MNTSPGETMNVWATQEGLALPEIGCRRQRHRIHSRLLLCIRPDMTTLLGRSGRAEEFDVSLPDSLTLRFRYIWAPDCMGPEMYGTRDIPQHCVTPGYRRAADGRVGLGLGIPHQWRYPLARDLGALLALQVRRRVMGGEEGSVSHPPPMVDPVFGAVLVLHNCESG